MTNPKDTNPYYGLTALFALLHNGVKSSSITHYLNAAWKEVKGNKLFRELFHVICFSIGDISNRKHNIFVNKENEQGGNSSNERWLEYLAWLITNDANQFVKFIPLIVEYVGLRELVQFTIKTEKHQKKIVGSWGLLKLTQSNTFAYRGLIAYLADKISNGTPFERWLVAKFIHTPKFKQRKKVDRKDATKISKRSLQVETIQKMQCYDQLCRDLSVAMGWEIELKKIEGRNTSYAIYTGYREWRKQFTGDLAVVLFSNQKILDFTKGDFLKWLNSRTGGERRMVRRWVMDKDNKVRDEKYKNLAAWILEWETMKEAKQQEARNLSEKERTVGLTVEEKILKEKVDRQAKVTTGAETLFSVLEKIMEQKERVDKITLESVYNKLKFNVKTRVVADFSGSMRQNGGRPIRTAAIAATAATMLQNDNQYDLIMGFSRSYRVWSSMQHAEVAANSFMRGSTEKIKLIDRKDSFYDNYLRVLRAYENGEAANTDPCQIALAFKNWVDASPNAEEHNARVEEIQSCPVMLIISDGDFNCSNTPGSSMAKLQSDLKHWFNYEPIFVIWNIPHSGGDSSRKFDFIGNILHVTTWNISTINNIFQNISSMDIVDQFIELKTLSENNRYDLVKAAVI